jgi:hypothetical protein
MQKDELEKRFIVSPACQSYWTRLALKTQFEHPKFGKNLSCRITKQLLARDCLRKMLPTLIARIYEVAC